MEVKHLLGQEYLIGIFFISHIATHQWVRSVRCVTLSVSKFHHLAKSGKNQTQFCQNFFLLHLAVILWGRNSGSMLISLSTLS